MGAYAAWFEDQRQHKSGWLTLLHLMLQLCHNLAQRFFRRHRLLLVADFEPSRRQLMERLGCVPAMMALPVAPENAESGVEYCIIVTGTNPLEFGKALPRAKQRGIDVAAFWLPFSEIRGKTLLHLWRNGIRWVWLLRGASRIVLPIGLLLVWRGVLSWWEKRRTVTAEIAVSAEQASWLSSPSHAIAASARPLRIGHFIRTWMFGGVEKQLAMLAGMQHEAGHSVRVFLQTAPLRQRDGSLRWLNPEIPVESIATRWSPASFSANDELLWSLPDDLRGMALDLAGALRQQPVDVLHCWIDEANLVGMTAAKLADIPAVAMTALGVSPARWPLGCKPWMRSWYRAGLSSPQVALICISEAGCQDYAGWLKLPEERLSLIRIGFPLPAKVSSQERAFTRQNLGVPSDMPLIVGVFRLDPEKRPLQFLSVIDRIRKKLPDVRVIHAGDGALSSQFMKEIERLQLQETVRPLGQPADVMSLISASDVFLMLSEAEGTPIVSLEAQALGCVPILTDVGGCAETMIPGVTGLVLPKDDLDGFAAATVDLLREVRRRHEIAAAGRGYVQHQFSPSRMLRDTSRLYEQLTGSVARRQCA